MTPTTVDLAKQLHNLQNQVRSNYADTIFLLLGCGFLFLIITWKIWWYKGK